MTVRIALMTPTVFQRNNVGCSGLGVSNPDNDVLQNTHFTFRVTFEPEAFYSECDYIRTLELNTSNSNHIHKICLVFHALSYQPMPQSLKFLARLGLKWLFQPWLPHGDPQTFALVLLFLPGKPLSSHLLIIANFKCKPLVANSSISQAYTIRLT